MTAWLFIGPEGCPRLRSFGATGPLDYQLDVNCTPTGM